MTQIPKCVCSWTSLILFPRLVCYSGSWSHRNEPFQTDHNWKCLMVSWHISVLFFCCVILNPMSRLTQSQWITTHSFGGEPTKKCATLFGFFCCFFFPHRVFLTSIAESDGERQTAQWCGHSRALESFQSGKLNDTHTAVPAQTLMERVKKRNDSELTHSLRETHSSPPTFYLVILSCLCRNNNI